jgi:hypothetical protein
LEQTHLYLITDQQSRYKDKNILRRFRHVKDNNCPHTHNQLDLCCKTAKELELFYQLLEEKADLSWLCRFDDDQYVNLNNLYDYLSKFDASHSYYIGRTSITQRLRAVKANRTFTFATYGAGVCYSRALLERARSHMSSSVFPQMCVKHELSDDACMGFVMEIVLNVSLSVNNDRFHSHLEQLGRSFRRFTLNDLHRMITLGFAWDRYQLNWLPVIHQLIQLIDDNQRQAADRLWLFMRNYENEHAVNLTDQYDQSCLSYQRRTSTKTTQKHVERTSTRSQTTNKS